MKESKITIVALALTVAFAANGGAFQKGMSLASYWHDQYSYPESDSSIVALTGTCAEWVSILATWYQDSLQSTVIYRDSLQTPDDSSLIKMIDRAHDLGLKVMLKPHVDPQDLSWRALIEFDNEEDWQAWFRSYIAFITHYARLAQENEVEQFCVGCELTGTTQRETEWRQVIDTVRSFFDGPVTYAANWWLEYESMGFWDALDYVGIDGYYELTESYDPSLEELIEAWQEWLSDVEEFYEKTKKPILITEIGYRSVDGCNTFPWDWWSPGPVDLEEQADCYAAACSTLMNEDWCEGIFFWSWEVDRPGGPEDTGYTPRGKPAEAILRDWYTRHSPTQVVDATDELKPVSKSLMTYPVPFRENSFVDSGPGTTLVYDSSGRLVRVLSADSELCSWDGRDATGNKVRSGVYIYRSSGRTAKTVYIAD